MIIYLVNKDSEHAKSLMLKLDGPHKDGEFIQCTQGEMDSINKKDIVQIQLGKFSFDTPVKNQG